jgi:Sporulation and spore germination
MIKKMAPFFPLIIILILLITVLIMFNFEKGRSSYVLFFPLDSMNGKNAEIREVYRSNDSQHKLEIFISELILGPVALKMNPFIPEGTKIRSFVWRDEKLYLDLNKDFIRESASIPLDYIERIAYLKENIFFNFSQIELITVTVEGQIPGSEFYGLSEKNES